MGKERHVGRLRLVFGHIWNLVTLIAPHARLEIRIPPLSPGALSHRHEAQRSLATVPVLRARHRRRFFDMNVNARLGKKSSR